jgi:phosphate transport system substrate-binding protein
LLYKNPDIRAVPLGPEGGPFLLPTHETIANHSYALTRSITAYIDRAPGKPADPRVEAFLRYVLSPEGQQAVIEDGGYTPLPPTVANAEAAKLESRREKKAP